MSMVVSPRAFGWIEIPEMKVVPEEEIKDLYMLEFLGLKDE